MKFYEEYCEPKNFHLGSIDREILAKNSQKTRKKRAKMAKYSISAYLNEVFRRSVGLG